MVTNRTTSLETRLFQSVSLSVTIIVAKRTKTFPKQTLPTGMKYLGALYSTDEAWFLPKTVTAKQTIASTQ